MDDVLIHAPTQDIYDTRVRQVLVRLQTAGIILNDKCKLSKRRITFLGHIISDKGVEIDLGKIKAVQVFPRPSTVIELQRFHDMVNQLAKFICDLSSIDEPLRQLIRKWQQWLWDQLQEGIFQAIKKKFISSDILAQFDPSKQSIVATDPCQDGLGAVLLQVDASGNRRAIAYALRSFTTQRSDTLLLRKKRTGWHMGMREILSIHPRDNFHSRNKPLTPGLPIVKHRPFKAS